jgi:hypothetical protein
LFSKETNMTLILSGSDGLSDVDGTAAAPALRGTDTNTGIFFGTDIIGFSEGGVEAMRINASGNLQTIGTISVGNATPSTSGAGITFPATQSASTDANTLDDYEEGTWTATIIGATTAGTASYTAQTGQYTKIGNTVAITLYIDWSGGTGTGGLRISGLPFTSAASRYQAITIGQFENVAKTIATTVVAQINPNTTAIVFVEIPTSGGANTSVNYDAAGNIFVSGVYFV